jgi:hypothetical protein
MLKIIAEIFIGNLLGSLLIRLNFSKEAKIKVTALSTFNHDVII